MAKSSTKPKPEAGVWILAARVEGESSLFPPDERMGADFLRRMAESYDPDFRIAPVVCGWNPRIGAESAPTGGSHWAGEMNPPLGYVRDLDFDGLNLWALVEEITDQDGEGLLTKAVAAGFWNRSVGFWRFLSEIKGGPPYLRHLAILGGEQPGIPALPPLTDYFVASTGDAVRGRIIASAPYEIRSLEPQKRQENDVMDPKELAALIVTGIQAAFAPIAADIRALRERPVEPPAPPAASPAVSAEVAAEIKGLRDLVTAQAETVATLTKTVADRDSGAHRALVTSSLDDLVRSGRMSAALRDSEQRMLDKLPAEDALARLKELREMLPSIRSRVGTRFVAPQSAANPQLSTRMFSLCPGPKDDGPSINWNPEGERVLIEAMKAAGESGKFEDLRAAAYRIAGEEMPGAEGAFLRAN